MSNISFITHRNGNKSSQLGNINVFQCDFNSHLYNDKLFNDFKIAFPSSLNRSVSKRRAEFLAGRYVASLALNDLNVNVNEVPIGKHRSPVWPVGIVASITHTESIAMCSAAIKDDIGFLGIDLENWLSSETVQEIKNNVISCKEERLIRNSGFGFERAFTLVFSAKESLFKALYPSVGDYFDFSAAEIIQIDLSKKLFNLRLLQNLTTELTIGTQFIGYFEYDSKRLFTSIALRATVSQFL